MPAPLFDPGWLAEAVDKVARKYVAGDIKLEAGKALTATVVAQIIQKGKKMENPPSTGAVNAVFDRWEEMGYATFNSKPKSFKAYTARGKKGFQELAAIKKERSASRNADKPAKPAAKKASKAAAKKALAKGATKRASTKKS